ncbi:MAG TPA: DEAD/DEAH box helicase family protein [Solirubrobacteraceae bacterium]|nr:DEAD/DEAH box helicase family protein [Solirubrobacteraceae bacterium]
MTVLREWQERALERLAGWDQGSFLLSAAPGAGKTIPSLAFARRLLDAAAVDRVHVVCPTTPLTRQWAEVAGRFGIQLAPDSEELHPPRDFHGIAATYARVASSAARWAPQCGARTLIVADEAHHLGDELAWGEGFAKAFAATPRWLLLSGTPFRSDGTAIAGVRYDAGGMCIPDVSYTYADAVRDGICRPVVFVPYDGALSWQSGDEVIESSFADSELSGREASRRYRTAISTELADGLPRILRAADERLTEVRASGHKDAGGLVVTADGGHARRVAAVLKEITGRVPVVVVHTDARAAAKLRAFGAGRERWIVAVNMVSEGVDIPRLRVGVYATAAKTPLMFRQIVGRFVRTLAGRPAEHSYLFLPADRLLRSHAAEVETELRHVLRAPPEGDGLGLLDEPPARRESERAEPEAFLALNADVAPQLALFSGGPPPPVAAAARPAAAFPPAVAPEPEEPVFRRRRRLRDKRTGLVRTLAGMDGRTYREINTWLNRQTKVDSVDAATVEQLERSIELLQAELDRIGRRRARRAS